MEVFKTVAWCWQQWQKTQFKTTPSIFRTYPTTNFHMQDSIGLCSGKKTNIKEVKQRFKTISSWVLTWVGHICFMALETGMSSHSNSGKLIYSHDIQCCPTCLKSSVASHWCPEKHETLNRSLFLSPLQCWSRPQADLPSFCISALPCFFLTQRFPYMCPTAWMSHSLHLT